MRAGLASRTTLGLAGRCSQEEVKKLVSPVPGSGYQTPLLRMVAGRVLAILMMGCHSSLGEKPWMTLT